MEQLNGVPNQQDPQQVPQGQEASGDGTGNIRQGEGAEEQPKFVSQAELMQILEQHKRETQSMVDKKVSHVDERLKLANARADDILSTMKASNIQVTEQQAQLIRNTKINQALAEPEPTEQQTPPAQAGQSEQLHPVDLAAQAIINAAGITLEDSDPEIGMINSQAQTAQEYLATVQAAADAKRKRMASVNQGQAAAPGALGGGRSAGGGLLAQYQTELAKIPRGQVGALKRVELQRTYRGKGLNV